MSRMYEIMCLPHGECMDRIRWYSTQVTEMPASKVSKFITGMITMGFNVDMATDRYVIDVCITAIAELMEEAEVLRCGGQLRPHYMTTH